MKTYFITRHSGAVEWAASKGFDVTETVEHVTDEFIEGLDINDVVIGILPYHLAARVCAKHAHFYNLAIPAIPQEYRGKELNAEQMEQFGACVTKYYIETLS